MKRLGIAIIIFTLTIAFCIVVFFTVMSQGERLIETISSGMEQAENSSAAELTEIAEKINKEWSCHSTLFKSVFMHDEFAEVETLLEKLKFFAEQNSRDDFVECGSEAIFRLRYALDNEKPKFSNIF